ncbi:MULTISPECIES: hypothetical protein [Rhizobium]|uniref:hypothetical protein n=1 Tax=Rhizobium TaxID=379 RepID=UPI0004B6F982|nr:MULTISPECIES: hypothetical protein [Rhizobium]NEH37905.1 hypothetical protein [Rhizobium ruizarguesonis]WFT85988.1 hypothetical protein QA638_24415 [Rhizobium leguminosarum]
MALFDTKKRTRTSPMRPGEKSYDFYDTAGRASFDIYRDLVNGWISEFPDAEQAEVISRMKIGTNAQYEQTLAEIVIFLALTRLGHLVEIHPECPHPTHRPDFLVRNHQGDVLAYVEVTSFGPDQKIVARDHREAEIYNALETVDLPAGWLLGYEVDVHGAGSPSLNKLKTEVEQWAQEVCGEDSTQMPRRIFEAQDWRIDLTLLGGFRKDKQYERKIGAAMAGVREVSPQVDLRLALRNKARKYRIENVPYVIVVADCKNSIPVGDHVEDTLIDGLFGTRHVVFKKLADGSFETFDDRGDDGFWGRHGAPRNRNVSAVAILPEPNLWKLRDDRWQPIIAYNPFAINPVSSDLLPLAGFGNVDNEEGYGHIEGSWLADLLGLPGEWPPADE